jgi:uncharacterized membrane protein YfcA
MLALLPTLLAALLIGACLGLLGSGGSTLTVPALVYVASQDEKTAIAGSLFIVGTVALAGALLRLRSGLVRPVPLLVFGIVSAAAAATAAHLARDVSGELQLTVFAMTMVIAASLMLRGADGESAHTPRPVLLAFAGLASGALTGFVGIGGGFLIVPSLHVVAGLPLREAIATSLAIIALNAYTGFAAYALDASGHGIELDARVLATFAAVGVVGAIAGSRLSARLPQRVLKRIFALIMLLIGSAILLDAATASWTRLRP